MNDREASLLEQLLAETRRQTAAIENLTEVNLKLVEALAEESEQEDDTEPSRYLDGTPVPGR
ncbi:hypothetical protein [Kushneria phosphatilytica]|uniref:Uncharacterized protein n=1 Tax=Kushneria phosphatilytica TaxID=657387 RepID=A0A1S1NYP4_9GAMM|nr:hypothetical protein [Kushneria phosphatilytica]OHV13007.1 hypothetical protein BH688_03115 [Kushneria phosphatilytica]QEL10878.1 hypothetical protein FY550_06880 [Kushneria phosphatilytica]